MAKHRALKIGSTVPVAQMEATDAVDNPVNVSGPDVFLGRKTAGEGGHEELTISGLPAETTPASGDLLLIEVGGVLSKLDIANLPAGGASYDVYTALLNQSGTSAPTATVLENTLGGTVVWTRVDVGDYSATLTGAFTSGKTWWPGNPLVDDGDPENGKPLQIFRISADEINIKTRSAGGGDGQLVDTKIEFRVYP